MFNPNGCRKLPVLSTDTSAGDRGAASDLQAIGPTKRSLRGGGAWLSRWKAFLDPRLSECAQGPTEVDAAALMNVLHQCDAQQGHAFLPRVFSCLRSLAQNEPHQGDTRRYLHARCKEQLNEERDKTEIATKQEQRQTNRNRKNDRQKRNRDN